MTTVNTKRDELKKQLEEYVEKVNNNQEYPTLLPSEIHDAEEYINGIDLADLRKKKEKYGNIKFNLEIGTTVAAICLFPLIFLVITNIWYSLFASLAFVVVVLLSISFRHSFAKKEKTIHDRVEKIHRTYERPTSDLLLLRSLKKQEKEYNIEPLVELFHESYIDNVRVGSKKALKATTVIAQNIIEKLSYLELTDGNEEFIIDEKWDVLTRDLKYTIE